MDKVSWFLDLSHVPQQGMGKAAVNSMTTRSWALPRITLCGVKALPGVGDNVTVFLKQVE